MGEGKFIIPFVLMHGVTSVGGNVTPNVMNSVALDVMPSMQQQQMHQANPFVKQQPTPQPAPNNSHMFQSEPITLPNHAKTKTKMMTLL